MGFELLIDEPGRAVAMVNGELQALDYTQLSDDGIAAAMDAHVRRECWEILRESGLAGEESTSLEWLDWCAENG
jgi:hypothetical protein